MTIYSEESARTNETLGDAAFAERVLKASPAITYVYDVQSFRSVYQNRPLEEVLGYAPPYGEDSAWTRLMHPDDQTAFPQYRERLRALRSGTESTWQYRLRGPDGRWRWFLSRDVLLASDGSGQSHLVVGTAADITDQKQIEHDKELLLEEARHRTRNFTTVMLTLARQSAPRNEADGVAAFDRFVGRMRAILDAGNLVMATEGRQAEIQAVIETALQPLLADKRRVRSSGPPLILDEKTAGGLMLAIHELTTNAMKYGALSNIAGTVAMQWSLDQTARPLRARMVWREQGGPAVVKPAATGFGTRLLQSVLPASGLQLDYAPDGLVCSFTFEPAAFAP